MKLAIAAFLVFSTSAFAKVKKEAWKCQQTGQVITATFTATSTQAVLVLNRYEDEKSHVPLSFFQKRQKTALNGSQKTVLTGSEELGYDSYSFKATFVRSQHPEFAYAGETRGQVVLETHESPSCVDPILHYEVLDCEVKLK